MSDSQETLPATGEIVGLAATLSRPTSFGIEWWSLLTDPSFLRNPYPELNRIRDLSPIHFDAETGIYFVLGHREFGQMARSKEMGRDIRLWTNSWSSPENKQRDPAAYELFREFQPQMINVNPPDHRRMRGIYEKAFRPANMAQFLPMIERECRQLLDEIPADTPIDFMTSFANLLPHRVSRNLFEISPEMDDQLGKWIAALSWIGNIIMTPEQKQEAHVAQHEFKAYVKKHLASRQGDPGEGFIGMSIAAFTESAMDEEETLNNVVMLISGSRTTLTLLGNGMLALLQNPDQFELLRANRTLLNSAIEEMLRYEPGSSIIPRAAINDFQCGDVYFPAGTLAIGLVGAINRDPAAFENPNLFDITRQPNFHFVFGGGPHICIGKALARMTAQVAFTQLMDRFPAIELAGKPEWWVDRSDQRGLVSLPLQLSPA